MDCGSCEFLTDIDKSQDGGTCPLSGTFHKFHHICDMERIERDDKIFVFPKSNKPITIKFVRQARWKGAGFGDYECTLCGEVVSGNRERYCPACGAEMYTDDEYDEMLREWASEDEADRAFYSLEGII